MGESRRFSLSCMSLWEQGIKLCSDSSKVECEWKDIVLCLFLCIYLACACRWELLAVELFIAAAKAACSANHYGR